MSFRFVQLVNIFRENVRKNWGQSRAHCHIISSAYNTFHRSWIRRNFLLPPRGTESIPRSLIPHSCMIPTVLFNETFLNNDFTSQLIKYNCWFHLYNHLHNLFRVAYIGFQIYNQRLESTHNISLQKLCRTILIALTICRIMCDF